MMPMSSPGWLNDLPEYMTEAEYRDLSEEISRAIEIVHDPTRRPSAQETVLVVEVTSPTTAREDLVDKRAQYATAGIPLYLVVVLDEKYDIWEIREFHLDAAAAAYRLHAVHRSVLELEQPVRLTLPIADLVSA